eukprot:m.357462 g.357462  ORF g.357462 m.357462 type:complete len:137 (+) comp17847_c0_seq1:85-495(+)
MSFVPDQENDMVPEQQLGQVVPSAADAQEGVSNNLHLTVVLSSERSPIPYARTLVQKCAHNHAGKATNSRNQRLQRRAQPTRSRCHLTPTTIDLNLHPHQRMHVLGRMQTLTHFTSTVEHRDLGDDDDTTLLEVPR